MRKIYIIALAGFLTACQVGTGIDLSNKENYGLKCSAGPNSQPNWEGCMVSAKRICAPLRVVNVKKLNPVGSGSKDDGHFMTFTCANSNTLPQNQVNNSSNVAPITSATSTPAN